MNYLDFDTTYSVVLILRLNKIKLLRYLDRVSMMKYPWLRQNELVTIFKANRAEMFTAQSVGRSTVLVVDCPVTHHYWSCFVSDIYATQRWFARPATSVIWNAPEICIAFPPRMLIDMMDHSAINRYRSSMILSGYFCTRHHVLRLLSICIAVKIIPDGYTTQSVFIRHWVIRRQISMKQRIMQPTTPRLA